MGRWRGRVGAREKRQFLRHWVKPLGAGFKGTEHSLRTAQHVTRHAGKLRHMQAPGFLGGTGAHTVAENHLPAPFAHLHGGQRQFRQFGSERRQFMEMRGEDSAAADAVMQSFQHRPGDGQAIPGGGAAPDLIQHHQGLRAGQVQYRCGFGHFDHEGGTPAGNVIRRANAGEKPIHQAKPRGFGGQEKPGLGQDHK